MLRLSLACGVLSLLLLQLLVAGESVEEKKSKAQKTCSAIPTKFFLGQTVNADYTLGDNEAVVSVGGCPVDLPKTSALGSVHTATVSLRALTEIKYWVCSNLRKANAAGVKTYIDTRFYEDLVRAIDTAQLSLQWLARYHTLHFADALEVASISAAAGAIQVQVAAMARRLPCFCRLLKLMEVPLKRDRLQNSAKCLALVGKIQNRAYTNIHKAATEEFWEPTLDLARLVPKIFLLRKGTCGESSLDWSWEPNMPLNWFDCAAIYEVNGYEVYMAPTGLMLYHGSRRMEPMYLPTGMMWFGELSTATAYLKLPQAPSAVPLNPAVHSFRTTKNIFLAHLMDQDNNELMTQILEALQPPMSMEEITGYPLRLERYSDIRLDKAIFAELCKHWPPGIAGYADNYPAPSTLYPEVMLCNTPRFVEPLGIVSRSPPRTVTPAQEVEPEPETVQTPKAVEIPETVEPEPETVQTPKAVEMPETIETPNAVEPEPETVKTPQGPETVGTRAEPEPRTVQSKPKTVEPDSDRFGLKSVESEPEIVEPPLTFGISSGVDRDTDIY